MTRVEAQLHAQLEAILGHEPEARTIAVRVESPQGLPAQVKLRGQGFRVRWCESRLALREALTEDDGSGLLLATPINDRELPADIAARLTRARVFQARDWELLRPLFGATSVDARLGRHEWLATALIELAGEAGYAPVPGRFLDLDTAWREFLSRGLGLAAARPDARELLDWSLSAEAELRFAHLSSTAQQQVLGWFEQECGEVGQLLAAATRAGYRSDALALAIVCEVLYAEGPGDPELERARVRLERYLDGRAVDVRLGRAWGSAAVHLARSLDLERLRPALERADVLLEQLHVDHHAARGQLTPRGFEQRLDGLAEVLTAHAGAASMQRLVAIEQATADVLGHLLAAKDPPRHERVEMARRLARWLLLPLPESAGYAEWVAWQSDQGAFVDWARFRLLGGDEHEALSAAYAALRNAVATRRGNANQRFAQLLVQVNREARWQQGRALPLESVLGELVAPLMSSTPVLLLVMDGLSLSIFRELLAQPEALGWRELVREDLAEPLVGVAALPTVTEVSRASLLCGTLRIGAQTHEKSAFATYPALLAGSLKKAPPLLFHKAEIEDALGLSSALRTALGDRERKLVGVVYNAVDDHLDGPQQLHQRWELGQLRSLKALLQAARDARRALLLTADHGHVLEEASRAAPGRETARWRQISDRPADAGEVRYDGGRVRSPAGESGVICLVDEALRYTGRKNGYHGGASLQEVCVPLSVFVPFGLQIAGWREAAPLRPEWWELSVLPESAPRPEPVKPARRPRRTHDRQPSLFDAAAPAATPPVAPDAWIDALLASPTYRAQRQMVARGAPPDAEIRALLAALDARGGKLAQVALAQRLKLPELRLGGFLSGARRLLNVEQVEVLSTDETTRMVVLNRPLLEQQFGIDRRTS